MVLWKGRFSKELNHEVNAFNSSLSFDHRMYKQDIRGSLAHAKMLCKQSIIEEKDYEEIVEGLNAILKEIEEGTLLFDPEAEDIHMFVSSRNNDLFDLNRLRMYKTDTAHVIAGLEQIFL